MVKPANIAIKPVNPKTINAKKAKDFYGGSWPKVNGRKHKYPSQTDDKGWVCLIAESLTYNKRKMYCVQYGLPNPNPKKRRQYEYLLYHARPEQKARRAQRNRDRRKLGLKIGDDKVVHHKDGDRLSKPEVITKCEHKRKHGMRCLKEKKSAIVKKRSRKTTKKKS